MHSWHKRMLWTNNFLSLNQNGLKIRCKFQYRALPKSFVYIMIRCTRPKSSASGSRASSMKILGEWEPVEMVHEIWENWEKFLHFVKRRCHCRSRTRQPSCDSSVFRISCIEENGDLLTTCLCESQKEGMKSLFHQELIYGISMVRRTVNWLFKHYFTLCSRPISVRFTLNTC